MVAASILLILVAVVLLVAGLAGGSSILLIVSIAASLLSAVAFVAFARQAAATRATAGREAGPRMRTSHTVPSPDEPVSPVPHHTSTVGAGGSGWRQPPGSPVTEPDDAPPPAAYSPPAEPFDAEPYTAPDPVVADATPYSPPGPRVPETARPTSPAPGEAFDGDPPAEFLSTGEVARLVRLPDEVLVVDGHPRFHLPDCPHLVGREDEPLPVAEAVALGFTPCARCAAATTLLAEARPR
ncbi:hypothetical protein F8279_15695 [Micromonospora sp. AMSO1212t]|uniref:hypothetical protein n=1 Tax=Micromonospora sp. AMSO1212t TaxID=2650565 RepID=UPI00124B3682|nr:hypothetical protein [Micromonospora sp. AMSO1212t]KAB1906035.1 hypothetical protein F8279_15695 [Micromonospora sp. AMSO1212t]